MNIQIIVIVTLLMVNFWVAFNVGVETGKAQTHTIETIVIPNLQTIQPRPHAIPPNIQEKFERMSYPMSDREENCMALNIYWEARDQDVKGKLAIGLVTMQRVMSKHYPNNVCGVVWQKNRDKRTGKSVAQFSWTLDGKPDIPKNKHAWTEAQLIASTFVGDGAVIDDFTKGAYMYHADYVSPYWKTHYDLQAKIGSHLFYK